MGLFAPTRPIFSNAIAGSFLRLNEDLSRPCDLVAESGSLAHPRTHLPRGYETSPRAASSEVSPRVPSLRRVISAGPPLLGRSVVIGPGTSAPGPWAEVDQYLIDWALLDDQTRLGETTDELQLRYVNRIPTVYVLEVDPKG